jgi:hypothetical protein
LTAIFLEVEINVGGLQLAGGGGSAQRRAASGVDSSDALQAMRRRQLTYPPADSSEALLGAEGRLPTIQDFNLVKVLGKGR